MDSFHLLVMQHKQDSIDEDILTEAVVEIALRNGREVYR